MVASLRALLSGIIDYAGLFPPAALPLDQAIRNYARYRQEPESWMLARFICPVARLEALASSIQEPFHPRLPFHLVALVDAAKDVDAFTNGIFQGLSKDAHFWTSRGALAVLDVLEARLPLEFSELPRALMHVLQTAGLTIYCEPASSTDWRFNLMSALGGITNLWVSGWMHPLEPEGPVAGLKWRCGGLHASAFPSAEQVASVIAACRDAKVPLKFTAGLHHPLRQYDAGVQTHMHGFLNVFVAGVLAHARGLSAEQLQPIIEDEDAGNFAFDDGGLHWKGQHATTPEIVTARKHGVTSFGSCSFDEPRDDLRAFGWLK